MQTEEKRAKAAAHADKLSLIPSPPLTGEISILDFILGLTDCHGIYVHN